MGEAHAAVGEALIGGVALFTLAAVAAALMGGARWIEWLRVAVTILVGIQASLGVAVYVGGDRPGENLHLAYGLVALAAIPFASRFATEAPPAPRAWTLAIAGLITVGVLWRSAATG
jgi:heme A synthase